MIHTTHPFWLRSFCLSSLPIGDSCQNILVEFPTAAITKMLYLHFPLLLQAHKHFNGFNPSRSLHQRRKYSHRTTHTSIHQRINRNTKDNNAESLYAKIKITLQVLYIAWCKNQCFFQNIPWSNLKVEQWIIYAWNGNNGSTIISKKMRISKDYLLLNHKNNIKRKPQFGIKNRLTFTERNPIP